MRFQVLLVRVYSLQETVGLDRRLFAARRQKVLAHAAFSTTRAHDVRKHNDWVELEQEFKPTVWDSSKVAPMNGRKREIRYFAAQLAPRQQMYAASAIAA